MSQWYTNFFKYNLSRTNNKTKVTYHVILILGGFILFQQWLTLYCSSKIEKNATFYVTYKSVFSLSKSHVIYL